MVEYCPYCGTKIKYVVGGKDFCPNCGVIEEPEEKEENGDRSYIG